MHKYRGLAEFNFCQIGIFLNSSKAKTGFKKLTKLVKSGFLMIIHIYAKVSIYWISLREKGRTLPLSL
ncbi:hypothetical protein [uncultured Gammaproteobacteria bacterium]|nr:hypothetical protein [uncultured Gammaproteobacteria bacterium]